MTENVAHLPIPPKKREISLGPDKRIMLLFEPATKKWEWHVVWQQVSRIQGEADTEEAAEKAARHFAERLVA